MRLNANIIKTFIRIQYAITKNSDSDEIINTTYMVCQELYSKDEIALLADEVFEDGLEQNQKVINKMMEMLKQLLISEYEGLNLDEDGLDEADRVVFEVLESIGNL